MPKLIVQGTTPGTAVRLVLQANLAPDEVLFTDDPFEINDALAEHPQTILGYADDALARACTAQTIEFAKAKRVVVLAFAWRPKPDEGADMVQQASAVLNATWMLDLNFPAAVDYLRRMVREV